MGSNNGSSRERRRGRERMRVKEEEEEEVISPQAHSGVITFQGRSHRDYVNY